MEQIPRSTERISSLCTVVVEPTLNWSGK